jgi:hypothetical protein
MQDKMVDYALEATEASVDYIEIVEYVVGEDFRVVWDDTAAVADINGDIEVGLAVDGTLYAWVTVRSTLGDQTVSREFADNQRGRWAAERFLAKEFGSVMAEYDDAE